MGMGKKLWAQGGDGEKITRKGMGRRKMHGDRARMEILYFTMSLSSMCIYCCMCRCICVRDLCVADLTVAFKNNEVAGVYRILWK